MRTLNDGGGEPTVADAGPLMVGRDRSALAALVGWPEPGPSRWPGGQAPPVASGLLVPSASGQTAATMSRAARAPDRSAPSMYPRNGT